MKTFEKAIYSNDVIYDAYITAQNVAWELFNAGCISYQQLLDNLDRIDRQYA